MSWIRLASFAFIAGVGIAVGIAAFFAEKQRKNEDHMRYGNGGPHSRRSNQRSQSNDYRQVSLEEDEKQSKIQRKILEERLKQLEERKKRLQEKKKPLEETKTERESQEVLLDSFDKAFDRQVGESVKDCNVNQNFEDWEREQEKEKLKQEFRSKQNRKNQ